MAFMLLERADFVRQPIKDFAAFKLNAIYRYAIGFIVAIRIDIHDDSLAEVGFG